MTDARNVFGEPLAECCTKPMTGFYRDGSCNTGPEDFGVHTVCTRVDADFLTFSQSAGNDRSCIRSQAKCHVPSESSLAIYADRIDFYESRGRVLAVRVVGERDVEIELESSGEGQVWRSMRHFRRSEDGRSLTDVTRREYPTVRVRCEEGRVGL